MIKIISYLIEMVTYTRQQILYYLAENLELRRNEFTDRLVELTGVSS